MRILFHVKDLSQKYSMCGCARGRVGLCVGQQWESLYVTNVIGVNEKLLFQSYCTAMSKYRNIRISTNTGRHADRHRRTRTRTNTLSSVIFRTFSHLLEWEEHKKSQVVLKPGTWFKRWQVVFRYMD